MATQQNRRRNVLLAVLLALIAAGTLCVFGAAAAGYTISSPLWDSIAAFFSGDQTAANGDGGTGGDGGAVIPPTGGDGTSDGTGDDGGDGTGDDAGGSGGGGGGGADAGENCFLGILCLNADAAANTNGQTGGNGAGGDATGSAGNDAGCFLGLVCLNAKADAVTNDTLDSDSNAVIEADEDGVRLDADSDDDLNLDLNSVAPSNEDNCMLGLVCLNANLDAVASNSWWNSFVSLFVSAEGQS